MAHFNLRQGLFQAKGQESIYVNDRKQEYIPYDYNFEDEIVPLINNLLPNTEKVELKREIKGVRAFLIGSTIGLCFRDFDFSTVESSGALFGAITCPDIDTLYFVNCRFGINNTISLIKIGKNILGLLKEKC